MASINAFNNRVLDANVLFNGGTFSAGTDATANTISIGTAGARLINIGSTSSLAIAIDCGVAGISVGTTANNHTSTFGSTNGTSTTVVQAGSGGITLTGVVTSANAITVTAGAITATLGNIVSTAGDITATLGNLNLTAATTAAVGQLKQAGNRLLHTYGTDNLFLGKTAGNFALTGNSNVGIGKDSLNALTTGAFNTALGLNSGILVDTGDNNVLIGDYVGQNIDSGSLNTGIGFGSFAALTTTDFNVAVGSGALNSIVTGASNIALGTSAGSALTTNDSDNICIGTIGNPGDNGIIRIGTSPTHTSTVIAGDVYCENSVIVQGDSGAVAAGDISFTNVDDTGVGNGAGVFVIKSKTANSIDSSGFIKIWIAGNDYYIPVFSTDAP